MDVLARFPRVWYPACNKTQPMIFDVMKAKDDDAAEIVCDEYKGRAPTGLACAPIRPSRARCVKGPRCTDRRRGGLHNTADHDAIGKHVVIVVTPFAGGARSRGAFEDQRGHLARLSQTAPRPDLGSP